MKRRTRSLRALDFFAGSGLVTEALRFAFDVVWANDICPKKRAVYAANFGDDHLNGESISRIDGRNLPSADVAWASFPCQDLSLAGAMRGMQSESRTRSSLYYEWIRVLDEMAEVDRPSVLCVENVVGFLVSKGGASFRDAYWSLRERGYMAGAFILDASPFVPQSRPRSFLVAVREGVEREDLSAEHPAPGYHGKSVVTAFDAANDPEGWVWWNLPPVPDRCFTLADIVEWDAPRDSPEKTEKLFSMLSDLNRTKLDAVLAAESRTAGTGYKRVRSERDGRKRQRFELRFDGKAGCLRMPTGGSSRQILVLVEDGAVSTRLLTVREAARLMGVRDSYCIPGGYNEGYGAMGDAVAVPVAQWIAHHLLLPLTQRTARVADVRTAQCA